MGKKQLVGKIVYAFRPHKEPASIRTILLTLIDEQDDDVLQEEGLRGLRLRRIVRLAREAECQGAPLGYDDLSRLLLTSLATLKRDVACLESSGEEITLKNRRRRCEGKCIPQSPQVDNPARVAPARGMAGQGTGRKPEMQITEGRLA